MRIIDADALIKRLAYCVEQGMGATIAFTFMHMIDEAPTIEPIEWVPCSERLPKEYGEYLITTTYLGKPYVTTDEYFSYGWDDWEEVIAWAERPKPWKGADDEGHNIDVE